MTPFFVDCHSHVVPSGDDGAPSVAAGLALCRGAAEHGTALLYATPHVWTHLPLTEEREREVRQVFETERERAPLELKLGWELTPSVALLDEDPRRYVLEDTDCVLVEVPFAGSADLFVRVCEHVEEAGLHPIVAHPERTESVHERPLLARELAERGWSLQVNATSLTGYHGPQAETLAWELLENATAALVASDGHRIARPPFLDEAYALVHARFGDAARRYFDGSAIRRRRRTASRAETRAA